MKRLFLFFGLCLISLMACAQVVSKPPYRLSVRWNTLSLLRLHGIGELEYAISRKSGAFVGGGANSPVVILNERNVKIRGWGLNAGYRLHLPIGKFSGLSSSLMLSFTRQHGQEGYEYIGITGQLVYYTYMQYKLGAYASLAYAQAFAKRFFVEPSIGLGPTFGQLHTKGASFEYLGLSVPVQINLGVRF